MKIIATLSLVLGLIAWVLMALTITNLLSGSLEARSCQTACVQSYFFSAAAAGYAAFLMGLVATFKEHTRVPGFAALVLVAPLCAIIAGLFLIGNFG